MNLKCRSYKFTKSSSTKHSYGYSLTPNYLLAPVHTFIHGKGRVWKNLLNWFLG